MWMTILFFNSHVNDDDGTTSFDLVCSRGYLENLLKPFRAYDKMKYKLSPLLPIKHLRRGSYWLKISIYLTLKLWIYLNEYRWTTTKQGIGQKATRAFAFLWICFPVISVVGKYSFIYVSRNRRQQRRIFPETRTFCQI